MQQYRDFIDGFDEFIRQSLASDEKLIEVISGYTSGGKRIRAKLCYLTGKSLGCLDFELLFKISAIIELIHTATLMHDDVVDLAVMRRGRETVHQRWSVPAAILTGDFIYSRAFQLAVSLENQAIVKLLADTSNLLAEGEVSQLDNLYHSDISESTYMAIIYKKTGVLFATSCESAALLAGCDPQTCQSASELGKYTGIAFQIIDDLLDYIGDSTTTGKGEGIDFHESKMTLPLMTALRLAEDQESQLVRESLGRSDETAFTMACALIEKTGADDYCRKYASKLISESIDRFVSLTEPSNYREELIRIVEQSAYRKF